MNREEFLKELESLLYDISPAERENALEYYRDYFADAGPENEAIVIRELGSPERVARTIRDGLYGEDTGEFTEQGYRDRNDAANARTPARAGMPADGRGFDDAGDTKRQASGNPGNAGGQENSGQASYTRPQNEGRSAQNVRGKTKKKTGWDVSKIILVVILCILMGPPAFAVLAGAACTVLGLVVAFFAVIFAVVVTVGSLMIAGIVSGICMIFVSFFMVGSPGSAFLTAGVGFLMLTMGIAFLILTGWVCGSLLPAVFKGIGKLFGKLFSKGGARA